MTINSLHRFIHWSRHWLIEPVEGIQRQEDRQQARLLSTLQLTILCVLIPAIFIRRAQFMAVSNILILDTLLIAMAYGLSRTPHFKIATVTTIVTNNLTPFVIALFGGDFANNEFDAIIATTGIGLLLGSMFLPFRMLLVHAVLNLLAILLVIDRLGLDTLPLATSLLTIVVISALIIVATRHRNQLERSRLFELAETNHELETIRSNLEERVEERTQELRLAFDTIQIEHETLLKSERMASLGRLTAGIAHEINTPLAASRASLVEINQLVDEYLNSLGDAEVTLDDYREIGKEIHQSLALTKDGLERIAGFVQGIKAQIRDAAPRDKILFNAVPVIRESLLLVNHALRASNCTATFDSPTESVMLFGLPGQLSQIVTNLISNAIDASAEKSTGLITLNLNPHSAGADLLISDQGTGIPAEDLPKIFDLLFTTKPTGLGTGLGLTIVRDIMTIIFQGSIDVDSQVGQGTTFTLHFPLPGENQFDT